MRTFSQILILLFVAVMFWGCFPDLPPFTFEFILKNRTQKTIVQRISYAPGEYTYEMKSVPGDTAIVCMYQTYTSHKKHYGDPPYAINLYNLDDTTSLEWYYNDIGDLITHTGGYLPGRDKWNIYNDPVAPNKANFILTVDDSLLSLVKELCPVDSSMLVTFKEYYDQKQN